MSVVRCLRPCLASCGFYRLWRLMLLKCISPIKQFGSHIWLGNQSPQNTKAFIWRGHRGILSLKCWNAAAIYSQCKGRLVSHNSVDFFARLLHCMMEFFNKKSQLLQLPSSQISRNSTMEFSTYSQWSRVSPFLRHHIDVSVVCYAFCSLFLL